jgi:hypothetical protein
MLSFSSGTFPSGAQLRRDGCDNVVDAGKRLKDTAEDQRLLPDLGTELVAGNVLKLSGLADGLGMRALGPETRSA